LSSGNGLSNGVRNVIQKYLKIHPEHYNLPTIVIIQKIHASHKLVSSNAARRFNQVIHIIEESLRHITEYENDVTNYVVDIWKVVRYINDPDKYVSDTFDFPEKYLRPFFGRECSTNNENFWHFLEKNVRRDFDRMRNEGYELLWQEETPSKEDIILPSPYRELEEVNVYGISDVLWVKEEEEKILVQIWDFKCHNDEKEFMKFPNASWLWKR
jgi:hypothetical protein